jgi:hypothetical protein
VLGRENRAGSSLTDIEYYGNGYQRVTPGTSATAELVYHKEPGGPLWPPGSAFHRPIRPLSALPETPDGNMSTRRDRNVNIL